MTLTAADLTDLQLLLATIPVGAIFVDEVVLRLGLEGDAEFKRKLRDALKGAQDQTKQTEDAFKKLGIGGGSAMAGLVTKISSFGKALFNLRTVGIVLLVRELVHLTDWLVKVGDKSNTMEPRIERLGTAFKDRLAGVLQKTLIPVLDEVITKLEKIAGLAPPPVTPEELATARADVADARAAEGGPNVPTSARDQMARQKRREEAEKKLEDVEARAKLQDAVKDLVASRRMGFATRSMTPEEIAQASAFDAVERGQGSIGMLPVAPAKKPDFSDQFVDGTSLKAIRKAMGDFVPTMSEGAKKAEKELDGFKDAFVEIPEEFEEKMLAGLQTVETAMVHLGVKGRGIFGGLFGGVTGVTSGLVGLSGLATRKASGDEMAKGFMGGLQKFGFYAQMAGGVLGLFKGLGVIGGPSYEEIVKGTPTEELREKLRTARQVAKTDATLFDKAQAGATPEQIAMVEAELTKRGQQGSQTIGGTITTLTEPTGRMILAEITSHHAVTRQYLPFLEEIAANTRDLRGEGAFATASKSRAAGI